MKKLTKLEKAEKLEEFLRFMWNNWDSLESYLFNASEDEWVEVAIQKFYEGKEQSTKNV